MPETYPFADDRPCVQLRVAGSLSAEVTLTLLLDLWTPNPNKVLLFPWADGRVGWQYSAAPTVFTSHDRYPKILSGGLLAVTTGSSWLPAGVVNAARLVPPLGGGSQNGSHPLRGVVDGYAEFSLFANCRADIDFNAKTTTVWP